MNKVQLIQALKYATGLTKPQAASRGAGAIFEQKTERRILWNPYT